MTDKQIIIDGVDVNSLYSDQIACMNRYEVARLFIKTIELLVSKEQECERLKETIIEIKEIAEFDCSCGHNQMCICNVCDKFDEILQKISECEV